MNSVSLSDLMATGLSNPVDYVYVDGEHIQLAEAYLKSDLEEIITPREEEE